MNRTMTIGIAGGTGSGKTTLSKFLTNGLSGHRVHVIHMDRYFHKKRPRSIAPHSGKEYEDFNHPNSVNLEGLLIDYHRALEAGDYQVIIIEGFMLFCFPELRDKLDIKVFVDCRSDERLARRLTKFPSDRYSSDEVVAEYLDVVRFRHDEFVEPTRWYADLVMNGSSISQKGSQMLLEWVLQKLVQTRNER
jgi:uridine kinase